MNQVQVTGSHNSYKQDIDPELFAFLKRRYGSRLDGLDYSQRPIEEQLNSGLRSLELDIVNDPKGGLYANPLGLALEKEHHLKSGAPYDPEGLMKKPGFKVLHVPDIDFRANAYTFAAELEKLKTWSEAHPRHLPIVITMNAKDEGLKGAGMAVPLKFDAAAFDAWDQEIAAGLGRDKLIEPDDVRGQYPTLESAVLAQSWPKLGEARGKFLFVLDEQGQKRSTYTTGHPSLKRRVMFVNVKEGSPEAAFRIVNDAKIDCRYIQYLVRSGYYVRTRADADTVEARHNDFTRQREALISGAQVISTDYYVPDLRISRQYRFFQAARWNALQLPDTRPLPNLAP